MKIRKRAEGKKTRRKGQINVNIAQEHVEFVEVEPYDVLPRKCQFRALLKEKLA